MKEELELIDKAVTRINASKLALPDKAFILDQLLDLRNLINNQPTK